MKLIATTYGEIAVGEQYSAIDDPDPTTLRFTKRHLHPFADHDRANSIPVYVDAEKYKPPEYTPFDLAEVKATIDRIGKAEFRIDTYGHVIIRAVKSRPEYKPQEFKPLHREDPEEAPSKPNKAEQTEGAKTAQRTVTTPSKEAETTSEPRTRIRWTPEMKAMLGKLAKAGDDPAKIAKALCAKFKLEVTESKVKAQMFADPKLKRYLK